MAKLGNLQQLNSKGEDDEKNVSASIYTFLKRKSQNSKNTKNNYERAIKDFFLTMRGKKIKDLVAEDLIFTPRQIESYQISLRELHKGKTVNSTMSALRECYKKMERDGLPVNSDWFDLERYDEHDSVQYGTLSHEEVVKIIDLVKKTRKGREKSLLIRLAFATAFRKTSLLTMKWNQIVNKDGIWCAKVLGKGNKWSYKRISADLYNELMAHKGGAMEEDKIFKLTNKTIRRMMDLIRSSFDFGDRWIVFHSFKKSSINEVNIITGGDIKAMQAQGDHANAQTTLNIYAESKLLEDLVEVDIDRKVSTDIFQTLSKEDIIRVIESMDRATKVKLVAKSEQLLSCNTSHN